MIEKTADSSVRKSSWDGNIRGVRLFRDGIAAGGVLGGNQMLGAHTEIVGDQATRITQSWTPGLPRIKSRLPTRQPNAWMLCTSL